MIYRTITFSLIFIFFILYLITNRKSRLRISIGAISFALYTVLIYLGYSKLGFMPKVIGEYFNSIGAGIMVYAFLSDKKYHGGLKGCYRYSRNPDILAYFMILIGMCLTYCTLFMIGMNILLAIILHISVLEREKHPEKFGKTEHRNVRLKRKKIVRRYLGRGSLTYRQYKCMFYFVGLLWCILYTITLLAYVGIHLSWIWIWPLGGIFCATRFIMIFKNIRVPKLIAMPYHILFPICFIIFITVELQIVHDKFNIPDKNLDYLIVLGAGLNGYEPSFTLRMRIERAYDYMTANPDTILIASGGQGSNELISEALCIKNKLVEMGIDESRIILEDKSTSTEENLKFSYNIIGDANASVGITTNSFHECRAVLLARRTGFTNVQSVPAKTLYPVGIHYTVREFFGIVKFWCT